MSIRTQSLRLLTLAMLAMLLAGCSGGDVKPPTVLPDFRFLQLNGHPVEKLNLELNKDKRILLLYFSRAYLRG